jgi:DNA-binding LytR/AlgR family response regulator
MIVQYNSYEQFMIPKRFVTQSPNYTMPAFHTVMCRQSMKERGRLMKAEINTVLICDDEVIYRQQIINCMDQYEKDTLQDLIIISYESGTQLLQEATDKLEQSLIIFLDVEMPDKSGMDTAIEIRKAYPDVNICFVTSHQKYAFESYGVDAIGFLEKPATYQEVKSKMEKAILANKQRLEREEAQKYFIRVGKSGSIIKCDNIIYIEKTRNKIAIHCFENTLDEYDTLKNLYRQLNQIQFRYVHESIIVNSYCIKEVRDKDVVLDGEITLPVSKAYAKELKEWHNNKLERFRQEKFQERRRELDRKLGRK